MNVQIADIGVQGNPHKIFPLTQSEIEKISIIIKLFDNIFVLPLRYFINKKDSAENIDKKEHNKKTAAEPSK